jgi:hypothetical protein
VWLSDSTLKWVTPESPILHIKWSQAFIRAVDEATIDNIPISETGRAHLRNPPQDPPVLDRDEMYSLRQFLQTLNAPGTVYEGVREEIMRDDPNRDILSLHRIEELLEQLTGVVPVVNDMCPESHCGFTGPFANMDKCPYCSTDRYEWVEVSSNGHIQKERRPRRVFYTIPIGPALQALLRSPEAAEQMQYRKRATDRMNAEVQQEGNVPVYTDYIDGTLYRDLVAQGKIRIGDFLVVFSGDGLQLLKMKKSDCWIYIWVILDLSPEVRFKKRYILPGGFVPGPEHMGNSASFILPGLQNLNAIMKEGLRYWDVLTKTVTSSNPFLPFVTADGVALADLIQVPGHRGYLGCRLLCPHAGRRKRGDSHYYAACTCANGPRIPGSDHPDYDPAHLTPASPADYEERLGRLMQARRDEDYADLRRDNGISGPNIFLGLSRMSPFPTCVTQDTMHIHGQNNPTLHLGLWHGSLKERDPNDKPADWVWRVLVGETWQNLGRTTEKAKSYLPGSFDRAPRNIAEKLNSGYKTWELDLWFYGLGVGYLMDVLPDPYYDNYTKLVFATRRKEQRKVSVRHLQEAHRAQVEYHRQFENIYYQQRPERLSFCRWSLHSLLHGAPEIMRVGPLALLSQWPLERTIGDLGRQVRNFQGPKMYANFAHMAWRQAQINALYNLYPDLAPSDKSVTERDRDLGGGYYLLRRGSDKVARPVSSSEGRAIHSWLCAHDLADVFPSAASVCVPRWARARLPNGQIVRSLWKEQMAANPLNIRMARNIKVSF